MGGGRSYSSEQIQIEMHFKVLFSRCYCVAKFGAQLDVASWMYHRIAGVFNSAPALVVVRTVRLICTFYAATLLHFLPF